MYEKLFGAKRRITNITRRLLIYEESNGKNTTKTIWIPPKYK